MESSNLLKKQQNANAFEFDDQIEEQQSVRHGARTKDALKKLFEEKARDLYDEVICKDGGIQATLSLKKHFQRLDKQRGGTSSVNEGDVEGIQPKKKNTPQQEAYKQRFIEEALHELEHRYRSYGRVRMIIERFRQELAKLDHMIRALGKKTRQGGLDISNSQKPSLSQQQQIGSKLDTGIISGQLSAMKMHECISAFGSNSLYYTVSHGPHKVFKSGKYHIPNKKERTSGSGSGSHHSQQDAVRPTWNEFFTFTLTGNADESLVFEIFRHNSSEGDIQLDCFEVKLKEDPMLLDLLSDQNNHTLTFQSLASNSILNVAMHQPSFETDKSHSSNDDAHHSQQSTYKVNFRWRHSEILLKEAQLKKKKSQIEAKVFEEEAALKQSKFAYDMLMNFNYAAGTKKLLEVLGIPLIAFPVAQPPVPVTINESLQGRKSPSPIKNQSNKSQSPFRSGIRGTSPIKSVHSIHERKKSMASASVSEKLATKSLHSHKISQFSGSAKMDILGKIEQAADILSAKISQNSKSRQAKQDINLAALLNQDKNSSPQQNSNNGQDSLQKVFMSTLQKQPGSHFSSIMEAEGQSKSKSPDSKLKRFGTERMSHCSQTSGPFGSSQKRVSLAQSSSGSHKQALSIQQAIQEIKQQRLLQQSPDRGGVHTERSRRKGTGEETKSVKKSSQQQNFRSQANSASKSVSSQKQVAKSHHIKSNSALSSKNSAASGSQQNKLFNIPAPVLQEKKAQMLAKKLKKLSPKLDEVNVHAMDIEDLGQEYLQEPQISTSQPAYQESSSPVALIIQASEHRDLQPLANEEEEKVFMVDKLEVPDMESQSKTEHDMRLNSFKIADLQLEADGQHMLDHIQVYQSDQSESAGSDNDEDDDDEVDSGSEDEDEDEDEEEKVEIKSIHEPHEIEDFVSPQPLDSQKQQECVHETDEREEESGNSSVEIAEDVTEEHVAEPHQSSPLQMLQSHLLQEVEEIEVVEQKPEVSSLSPQEIPAIASPLVDEPSHIQIPEHPTPVQDANDSQLLEVTAEQLQQELAKKVDMFKDQEEEYEEPLVQQNDHQHHDSGHYFAGGAMIQSQKVLMKQISDINEEPAESASSQSEARNDDDAEYFETPAAVVEEERHPVESPQVARVQVLDQEVAEEEEEAHQEEVAKDETAVDAKEEPAVEIVHEEEKVVEDVKQDEIVDEVEVLQVVEEPPIEQMIEEEKHEEYVEEILKEIQEEVKQQDNDVEEVPKEVSEPDILSIEQSKSDQFIKTTQIMQVQVLDVEVIDDEEEEIKSNEAVPDDNLANKQIDTNEERHQERDDAFEVAELPKEEETVQVVVLQQSVEEVPDQVEGVAEIAVQENTDIDAGQIVEHEEAIPATQEFQIEEIKKDTESQEPFEEVKDVVEEKIEETPVEEQSTVQEKNLLPVEVEEEKIEEEPSIDKVSVSPVKDHVILYKEHEHEQESEQEEEIIEQSEVQVEILEEITPEIQQEQSKQEFEDEAQESVIDEDQLKEVVVKVIDEIIEQLSVAAVVETIAEVQQIKELVATLESHATANIQVVSLDQDETQVSPLSEIVNEVIEPSIESHLEVPPHVDDEETKEQKSSRKSSFTHITEDPPIAHHTVDEVEQILHHTHPTPQPALDSLELPAATGHKLKSMSSAGPTTSKYGLLHKQISDILEVPESYMERSSGHGSNSHQEAQAKDDEQFFIGTNEYPPAAVLDQSPAKQFPEELSSLAPIKPEPIPLEEEETPLEELQKDQLEVPGVFDHLLTPKFDTEVEPAHNEDIVERLSRKPSEVVDVDEVFQAESPEKQEDQVEKDLSDKEDEEASESKPSEIVFQEPEYEQPVPTNELPPNSEGKQDEIEEPEATETITVKRDKRTKASSQLKQQQIPTLTMASAIPKEYGETQFYEHRKAEGDAQDKVELPVSSQPIQLTVSSQKYQEPAKEEIQDLQEQKVLENLEEEANNIEPNNDSSENEIGESEEDNEAMQPFVFLTDQADVDLQAKIKDNEENLADQVDENHRYAEIDEEFKNSEQFGNANRLETCKEHSDEDEITASLVQPLPSHDFIGSIPDQALDEIQGQDEVQDDVQLTLGGDQEPIEDDEHKSNANDDLSPKNLSEVSVGKDEEKKSESSKSVDKEILQPTMQNMKRIELKNQRKNFGGDIATSNILALINRMQDKSQKERSDDGALSEHQEEEIGHEIFKTFNSQQVPQLTKSNPLGIATRFSVGGFKGNFMGSMMATPFGNPANKARSVFHEQIAQNDKLHMSQYSGKSAGSRIGMLMKSIDGGAMFARQALNKEKQQNSMSQTSSHGKQYASGSVQQQIFNNDELRSEHSQEGGQHYGLEMDFHSSAAQAQLAHSNSLFDQIQHQHSATPAATMAATTPLMKQEYYAVANSTPTPPSLLHQSNSVPIHHEPEVAGLGSETKEHKSQRLGHMFMGSGLGMGMGMMRMRINSGGQNSSDSHTSPNKNDK